MSGKKAKRKGDEKRKKETPDNKEMPGQTRLEKLRVVSRGG